METHPTPFAATVRVTALLAGGACRGINLSYIGQDGRAVANAFATPEDVEAHAHDLLALVAAARALHGDARFGEAPRVRSTLMRDLAVGEPRQATATLHETLPSLDGFRLSRFDRILASIPQVQA